MPRSFDSVFYGAAGTPTGPSDDEFNRVSFLSHFEGSNNGVNNAFDDGSASNHTITANGNVTQGSFGPFARPDGEWGVSFDGDDYLSVAETGADEFTFGTGNFTIEGWINNQAVDGSRTIVSTAQGNDFQGIWFGINGGNYYYIYNNSGGWSVIVDAGTPVVNAWTHFALVRNGTSNVVYINGTSIGSTTETARDLTNTNNLLAIGGRATASQYTISTMSNVRVVKGTAVYTGNFTPSTSKLTAITNTKLLTCQSNRFVDNSASPLTITPAGNPAVTAFGPFLTSSVYSAGTNGASLNTPGAGGDYLSFGNIGLDGHSGDFSIEGWIYPTSYSQYSNTIYGQGGSGATNNLLEISLNSSGQPHAFINQGSVTLQSTFVCPLNAWTFVQLKRTSGTLAIFINGAQSSTVSNTATIGSPNRGFVAAQSYDPSVSTRSFRGFICDVRVSVVTRSVSLPTAPLAVTDSNTKLLLNMADGQAIDSAAQNNLTLVGNANTSTDQAKFGDTSLHLDGTGDYVNVLPSGRGNIYNYTVEQWLYPTRNYSGSGNFDRIWSSGTALNNSVMLHLDNTTAPKIVLRSNDSIIWTSSVSISLNAWTHVAVSCDADGTRLYIAGTERATSSTVVNLRNLPFNIGTSITTTGFFQGFMDDFRISDFARYTGNFTAPAEPFADKGQ